MQDPNIGLGEGSGIIGNMRNLIFGNMTKWLYAVVAIPACIIAYNLIMALDKWGFFESINDTVHKTIDSIKYLSIKCPPLIHDFGKFTECMGF